MKITEAHSSVIQSSSFLPQNQEMPLKKFPQIFYFLIPLLSLTLLLLYSSNSTLLLYSPTPNPNPKHTHHCDLTNGRWVQNPNPRPPLYDSTCPFHRNAWNCLRNNRSNMGLLNSWAWIPDGGCELPRIDPEAFLDSVRGRKIGFVGDSLNENFVVAFLCVLRSADGGARKWKRKGAWRGGYFPRFDVTVAYHRAVLLAKYTYFLILLLLLLLSFAQI